VIRWPVPAFLVGVPRLGLGRRNRQGKLVQLGGAGLCGRVLVADDVVPQGFPPDLPGPVGGRCSIGLRAGASKRAPAGQLQLQW